MNVDCATCLVDVIMFDALKMNKKCCAFFDGGGGRGGGGVQKSFSMEIPVFKLIFPCLFGQPVQYNRHASDQQRSIV